jgi:hypothetical protein
MELGDFLRYAKIVSVNDLHEMGMDFNVYESKGIVRFKNGVEFPNVYRLGSYAYQYSVDKEYVFLILLDPKDNEYIMLEENERVGRVDYELLKERRKKQKDYAKGKSHRIRIAINSNPPPRLEGMRDAKG